MAIQPLADRIVVKVLEAKEVTKGGILLPETAKEKPQEGKVIAVGKGKALTADKLCLWKSRSGTAFCSPNTAAQRSPPPRVKSF